LADICATAELSNLWSIPDADGNAKNKTVSRQAFQVLSHKEQQAEKEVTLTFSNLEAQSSSSLYGDRIVAFADIHDILLARPECFFDKIHDHKLITRNKSQTSLMWTQHHVILDHLSQIRAELKEP
jgi:hypothetical protein